MVNLNGEELKRDLKNGSGETEGAGQKKFQAPRGTSDFYGREKRLRDGILAKLKGVFETYGFEPLETPAFENYEVLSAKFAGGEEILKETYSLEDQGGRKLGLRYDFTVPMARFFAGNPNLAKPFKRYALGTVWRDGPLKTGRYREFVQCDVDIVGVPGVAADAEILALACSALSMLEIPFVIKVNNRKLLNAMLQKAGVPKEKMLSAMLSLDKLEKIGWQAVEKELAEKGACEKEQAAEIRRLFSLEGGLEGKELAALEGASELKELFSLAEGMGFAKFIRFFPSLARGLNYYTGSVFEAFVENGGKLGFTSSIAAGGRYDEMIGDFLKQSGGRDEKIAAVGISFGLSVLSDVLERLENQGGENKNLSSITRAFVIPIGGEQEAFAVVQRLRAAGIASSIDLLGRGLSKNLEYASKQGIAFAVFVGPQEAKLGKLKLRDLRSGEEKIVSVGELISLLSR